MAELSATFPRAQLPRNAFRPESEMGVIRPSSGAHAVAGCWPTPEEYIPSGSDRVRVRLFTPVICGQPTSGLPVIRWRNLKCGLTRRAVTVPGVATRHQSMPSGPIYALPSAQRPNAPHAEDCSTGYAPGVL